MSASPCGCVQCPSCGHNNPRGTMRCYCGHFFFQMCGSTSPNVPSNQRLVIIEELGGELQHVGWFDAASGWWFCLSPDAQDGQKLPKGHFRSESIGNITGWREIKQGNDQDQP